MSSKTQIPAKKEISELGGAVFFAERIGSFKEDEDLQFPEEFTKSYSFSNSHGSEKRPFWTPGPVPTSMIIGERV